MLVRWRVVRGLLLAAFAAAASGCAGFVANQAAGALSGTGTIFAADDDPDFIADAAPFGLKTMEAVLEQTPEHQDLLLSLASGYTQYGYAFLASEADRVREEDFEEADRLDQRAAKMYSRAFYYGFRGLTVRHDRFEERLRETPEELFESLDAEKDVPLLYWTAAAWALSIAASELEPDAIADFPLMERLARWALALDEDFDDGAVHTLMISVESSRPGGDLEAAEGHFKRALALDGGRRAGTYLAMAENVSVTRQDVVGFHRLLDAALAIDPDDHPDDRLANIIMQRRAAHLKANEQELFLVTLEEALSAKTSSASGVESQP